MTRQESINQGISDLVSSYDSALENVLEWHSYPETETDDHFQLQKEEIDYEIVKGFLKQIISPEMLGALKKGE